MICTNGHEIDEYPERFRGGERLGVNFRGMVEYWKETRVFEVVFHVSSHDIEELNVHNALGESPEEHVEQSEDTFGEWRHIDIDEG